MREVDDALPHEAMDKLGTPTINATVDQALKIATDHKRRELTAAMDRLAKLLVDRPPFDRSEAW